MIRMKVFKFDMSPFGYADQEKELQNDQSEKGKVRYQKKLAEHEKEYAPIEAFIDEIGFDNIRKITTTSAYPGSVVYTVFYEDNGQGRK